MPTKSNEAGAGHTPTIENSATLYRHDSNIYINNDCELQQLAHEPLLRMYAEVRPETYEIISKTNPVLKAVVDLAKQICFQGAGCNE